MPIPNLSMSDQSCISEQYWIVTSPEGWSVSVTSQSETICLFTRRCHFICSVPCTPVWFSNLLWLFAQWILTRPQTNHSVASCKWVFWFSVKKLSWNVMSMVLFPFSLKMSLFPWVWSHFTMGMLWLPHRRCWIMVHCNYYKCPNYCEEKQTSKWSWILPWTLQLPATIST